MLGKQKQLDPVSGTLPGVFSKEKRASMSSSMSPGREEGEGKRYGEVSGDGMLIISVAAAVNISSRSIESERER